MMSRLNDMIRVIRNPRCWDRLGKTDVEWDFVLNGLIDKYKPSLPPYTRSFNHTIMLGEILIWTANFPYSYGSPYALSGADKVLPTRKTVFRLYDMVELHKSKIDPDHPRHDYFTKIYNSLKEKPTLRCVK